MKRALDVAGALLGLLLSAPLLLAAGAAIWLADRRPILFSHEREGRGGEPVRLLKLRTMMRDGDGVLAAHLERLPEARREWERFFRLADDPRVLGRLGRALRRSSVDELPQLWNVLRGDMSLVGPRPLPPFVIAALPERFLALRRRVRPGLTGLWQVSGRSDGDMDELVRLDTEYVQNASLALDLRILARTPAAVLSGAGAY
jgi:lipopolysaccharide/colanic/teichoic acid biosynthesis glycosyltransferase